MTDIAVALIASLGGVLGGGLGVIASARLTAFRLEQLEKKVEKHNQVIERTYAVEKKQDICEEKLKVANHRICDLEDERKERIK